MWETRRALNNARRVFHHVGNSCLFFPFSQYDQAERDLKKPLRGDLAKSALCALGFPYFRPPSLVAVGEFPTDWRAGEPPRGFPRAFGGSFFRVARVALARPHFWRPYSSAQARRACPPIFFRAVAQNRR